MSDKRKKAARTIKSIRHRVYRHHAGRPEKEIDKEQVFEMARVHCTVQEIALLLKVDDETLTKYCREELDRGFAQGNHDIRKRQVKAALSGMPTMLIHLGKHFLGQRDAHYERDDKHRAEVAEIVDMLKKEYEEIKD
jgi:hypothetical protein